MKNLQNQYGKLIEIARYKDGDTVACKRCGSVQDWGACAYEFKDNGAVKCSCGDCGSYIKFMSTQALPRVWDFDSKSMEVLSNVSTKILNWYLHSPKTYAGNLINIDKELKKREYKRDEAKAKAEEAEENKPLFSKAQYANDFIKQALKDDKESERPKWGNFEGEAPF